MRRYFRRLWRAAFCAEPCVLDGPWIMVRVRQGRTFEEALRERSAMNAMRLLDWHRGE